MPDKEILITLGANIRKVRKERKLIQLDLEVASGIAAGDISKIENGHINVAFTTLIKIAEALKVELNELYTVVQQKPES
jgi:transcriptional regulator with XRE-family HTH domain